MTTHYNLIGVAEAAEILGVSKSTVLVNHKESAIAHLSCGPIWLRTQFTEPDTPLALPQDDTFIGFKETVTLMGISPQGLRSYTKAAKNAKQKNRRYFPLPVAEPSCGPIWLRSQVELFKAYVEQEKPKDVQARKHKGKERVEA